MSHAAIMPNRFFRLSPFHPSPCKGEGRVGIILCLEKERRKTALFASSVFPSSCKGEGRVGIICFLEK
jgi:hypothetical protein